MNVSKLFKMNFVIALTLLSSVCSVFSYPSKPLNERSKELAWQAWLLVDDQNNNRQYDPEMFARRRITPKSVFIAPTFRPDKLQRCDDGYVYDTNGKCRMIVKIDEAPYLEFLLQKLNEKYAETAAAAAMATATDHLDAVDADDAATDANNRPTPGPFQVNIPLGDAADKSALPFNNAPDVAAAADYVDDDVDSAKVKRTNGPSPPSSSSSPAGQIDDKDTTTQESTTTMEPTTMETTTTMITETATSPSDAYTTTLMMTMEDGAESETATTTEMAHALFFVNDAKNESANDDDLPLHEIPNGSIIIGSRIKDDEFVKDVNDAESSNQDFVQMPSSSLSSTSSQQPIVSQSPSNVQFPNPFPALPHPDAPPKFYPIQNDKTGDESVVDDAETNTQKHFDRLYRDYIISRGPDLKTNERHVFKTQKLGVHDNFQRIQQQQQGGGLMYNHRNRDKHFWNLPTDWGDLNVIVSSRRSPSMDVLHQQQQSQPESIYRQVPSSELSYLFGSMRRMPRHNAR